MKHRLKGFICFLLLTITINLSSTAYGQDQENNFDFSQYSESKIEKSEFFDKIAQAKQKVETLEEDVKIDILVETSKEIDQSGIDGNFKLLYDQAQDLDAVIMRLNVYDGDTKQQNQIYMPKSEKSLWVRKDETDKWVNQTPQGPLDQYHSKPNYQLILETILALKDQLKILESEEAYVLVPMTDSVDLFNPFQEHYDLKFDGKLDDLKQEAVFIFDKDNFNLTHLQLNFYFESKEGQLNMEVKTDFSNWNQLDPAIFEQNPEEATVES